MSIIEWTLKINYCYHYEEYNVRLFIKIKYLLYKKNIYIVVFVYKYNINDFKF